MEGAFRSSAASTISEARASLPGPDWLFEFSLERYEVMLKLFDQEDYQWILRQHGGNPRFCSRMRAERRRALRAYLRELSRDFENLRAFARTMILHSGKNDDPLIGFLSRQSIRYRFHRWALYVRLLGDPLLETKIDTHQLFDLIQATHARLLSRAAET